MLRFRAKHLGCPKGDLLTACADSDALDPRRQVSGRWRNQVICRIATVEVASKDDLAVAVLPLYTVEACSLPSNPQETAQHILDILIDFRTRLRQEQLRYHSIHIAAARLAQFRTQALHQKRMPRCSPENMLQGCGTTGEWGGEASRFRGREIGEFDAGADIEDREANIARMVNIEHIH